MELPPLPYHDPHFRFHHRAPDFLVISPPKTGSSWLAANLRHHPQLFVPEVKEVKYFCSLFKWLDLGWYAGHFGAAGERRAGEASPSYAGLPLDAIRQLRRLYPGLKLVYLMREPAARAWSHAKHNHRYREANFTNRGQDNDPALVTAAEWQANFCHEWTLASGDYLGHLRRWSSVFPANQLYVGFYESIGQRPEALLRDVFRFLEVDATVDLSGFPVAERVLPGPPAAITPELASALRILLRDRTEELVRFLKDRFGLDVPSEWRANVDSTQDLPGSCVETVGPFQRESDDGYVARVMALEQAFPSAFRFIEEYRGYNVVIYRGQMYALPRELGPQAVFSTDSAGLQRWQSEGVCLSGRTLLELRERITTRLLEQAQDRLRDLESCLRQADEAIARARQEACEATANVAAGLAALTAAFNRPCRARRIVGKVLGPPRRKLRAWLAQIRRFGSVAKQS